VHEFQIVIALIERANEHQFGPQDTIRKVLKHNYLKCFHIVCLNLKWMSCNQKKGWESNWERLHCSFKTEMHEL
jgi:hypothetical protein